MALLVEYYDELPQFEDTDTRLGGARFKKSMDFFKKKVAARYSEGTLQRLVASPNVRARRAAVLALGYLGTMGSNKLLALMLRDEDPSTRQLASDSLWAVWFRGDSPENHHALRRLVQTKDPNKLLAGLDGLIQKAPNFAEAFNQRAILFFRLGEYPKAIADCEKTLRLNPCHFGAQAGLAQCYMKLRRPKPALKAFRNALRLNPSLEDVEQNIRALEDVLGDEGRRDDKK